MKYTLVGYWNTTHKQAVVVSDKHMKVELDWNHAQEET